MKARTAYTSAGVLLGVGAPLGAALLRRLLGVELAGDLSDHAFFYGYLLGGSSLVFGVAGYLAGRRAEALSRSLARFEGLAEHDPLTGLPNGRAFRESYRRALEHAAANREAMALLVVDVDELKAINDRYGHATGSRALRHVANVLKACKRDADLAARWGGDEFTILMPGADRRAAERLASSILEELRAHPMDRDGPAVSTTIGIAVASPENGHGNLFELADQALYLGKQRGRDRFEVR